MKVLLFLVGFAATVRSADDWSNEYLKLLRQYYAPGSRSLECMTQRKSKYVGKIPFLVVGLEGAGHHMVVEMDLEMSGLKNRFRGSYPSGWDWRRDDDVNNETAYRFPSLSDYDKFLVVSRDPVDTHFSALRRFWGRFKGSMAREQDALLDSMARMQREMRQIDCDKIMFLPYEVLTRKTEQITKPMAAFLDVDSKNPKLLEWVRGIKRYDNSTWPRPISRYCGDEKIGSRFLNKEHHHKLKAHWADDDGWIAKEFPTTRDSSDEVDMHAVAQRLAAEYYTKTSRWFYEKYLPTHKELYDVVPEHPMSFCAPPAEIPR